MSLLQGSLSVSRFHLGLLVLDCEAAAFVPIPAGDEENVPKSFGFVPMKPGEPYAIGTRRWAGKVRVDEVTPDPVVVRDRYEELLQEELSQAHLAGAGVGKRRRKELKELAIAESIAGVKPSRRYIEWLLDGNTLYIASTSLPDVSLAVMLFRRIGGENILPVTPWETLPSMGSTVVELAQPFQSVWGARFLRHLADSGAERVKDVSYVVEGGRVALQAADSRISITGDIWPGFTHHLEQGAEPVVAKLFAGDAVLTLDGLSWWIRGLSLPDVEAEHWTEALDARQERIEAAFDHLGEAFTALRPAIESGVEGDGRAFIQESVPGAHAAARQFQASLPKGVTATVTVGDRSVTIAGPEEAAERNGDGDGDENCSVAKDLDDRFDEASRIVVWERKASASHLQRRMSIGYTRAARLINMLEAKGVLGPAQGSKPRDVLLPPTHFDGPPPAA